MNAFCDGNRHCRQISSTASRAALIAGLMMLGGCSWFEDSEPAFPPSSGGPTIATVPNGLPGDGANADYTEQELRALLGNAPRPLPPPPAAPKAADTNAPDDQKPQASTPPADSATPGAVTSTQPGGSAPAVAPGTSPVPDTSTNNPGAYPDINTVPMQRPTPVPDPDAPAPQATTPTAPDATTPGATAPDANTPPSTTPPADPTKPKQSSMATPPLERLMVQSAAGSSPAAPAPQASDQTAQSVSNSDDDMFSKPALPAYSGYDQTQKQPQGVPAQQLYRSPYGGPTELGQPAPNTNGSVIYASQTDGTGSQLVAAPGGQPVGLVYFGIGSTHLAGTDRQVLKQIADLQQAYGGVIRIVGHASSRTENMPMDKHQQTNVDIAAARAKAVAQQLVRFGVKPLFVQIAGASDTQPLYPEIMPAGEAANRRAEIYISNN